MIVLLMELNNFKLNLIYLINICWWLSFIEAIRKYRAKFFKNPDVISILIPVEMNCGNDESDKTKEILHLSNLEYSKQKVVQDQAKELQKPKKT